MKWIERKPVFKYDENDTLEEKIAKIRGIKDIERFLNPSKEELFDPYEIKNIQEASNRIIKAIKNGENIVVSIDCDSDGVTSGAIMIRYLKNYTDKVDFIYGERGYGHGITEQLKQKGLNEEEDSARLELARENLEKVKNADLLIIIDSSSNDSKTCEDIVNTFGCDIIILDHHDIEVENPSALIVNPQQDGCEYPNKQLSGAGVVFKTIEVIEDTLGDVDIWQYVDLVAVGIYSDMMKVDVFENRYLIMQGLRNMKNVGLVRILKGAKADMYRLNGDTIGFSIAPLLNGVARLDNIRLAIDILLTDDDNEAKKLRLKMHKLNESRKEIQKEIVERYSKNVDATKKILIVMDDESSKGFNGLVSQQLSEKYRRPAIVGRLHKGKLSGSFRSYGKLDLKEFLKESNLVEEAQGHPGAGGITVLEENIPSLIEYIEDNLGELESKERFVLYDIELDAKEVEEAISTVEKFNLVTGNGFNKVYAKVNNIMIEEANIIGKTMETAKIKSMGNLELIKFKTNEEFLGDLGLFDKIECVGVISMNVFYNFKLRQQVKTPQVQIEDYNIL